MPGRCADGPLSLDLRQKYQPAEDGPQIPRHRFLSRRITLWGHGATIRRVVRSARQHGCRWGEHAQGGSYLISGLLSKRMRERGYLEHGEGLGSTSS